MGKNYKTRVNDTFEFDIHEDELAQLDSIFQKEGTFHVLTNSKSVKVEVLASDFNDKSYQLKIGTTAYKVDIQSDLHQLIKEMGLSLGSSKLVNQIKAPMPGLILDINVSEGQEVKENDKLVVIEAMKMENVLVSPRDGIIKSINVAKGNTVDKGALIVEFD